MNWDAIGAIGEILGAAAVVLSLAYLATQIRQNTKSAQAASRDSISRSTIDVLTSISHDAESSKLYFTGLMNPDALDEDGVFRFDMMLYAVFESHESAFAQWKRGVLTDSDWEKWKWIIGNYMAAPGVQRAWLARGLKPALSQAYQDYIEELGVGQGWPWMHRPPADT
jgi:hypothetical protein